MNHNHMDPFELTKQLIETVGVEATKNIARENCWDGILAQTLLLEPALAETDAVVAH